MSNEENDLVNAFLKMFENAGIQPIIVNPNNPKDLEALGERIKSEIKTIKSQKTEQKS